MTNSSLLFRFMYLATAVLAAANAIVVFRRKLYRDVPWFTIYLVFTSLGMLVDEVLWENQANFPDNLYVFFFVGWFITGCILTLATMFVLEGWRNLLNEYPAIRRLGLIVLGIVAVVLLALALASVPYGQSDSNRFGMYAMKIAFVAERSVRFVLVGLIAGFFMFTSYLALNWKHSQFGILLGYGLYCCVSLAFTAYAAKMAGSGVTIASSMIDSTAYLLTLLLWLSYLLRLEPDEGPPIVPSAKADLERWNEALIQLVKR